MLQFFKRLRTSINSSNVSADETKKMVEGIVKGIDGVKSVQIELQVVQLFNRKVVKDRLPAITLLDQTTRCPDRPTEALA